MGMLFWGWRVGRGGYWGTWKFKCIRICHQNLVSKTVQILYFNFPSKICNEITQCEFLFHMLLVPLGFNISFPYWRTRKKKSPLFFKNIPLCAMPDRTVESYFFFESFLLKSGGGQIPCPNALHIFQWIRRMWIACFARKEMELHRMTRAKIKAKIIANPFHYKIST